MALALYRKYRPATFAEVVGQEHVTAPLRTALAAGRINHAYLFSGPRGCGKTSSARIMARSLNCVQGPTPDPCGTCPSCVALAPEGPGSIDVVELDAASHGGVDDARDLRDRAFYAPAESRYRVFIIDEAHMVTTQGFNALLKIVEEPPEHLVFVFATTEPEKVLATIRSRTHHYPFRLLAPSTMRRLLEQVCGDEGVQVEPAVYPLVIRAGGGSARDSLSVLDQLLAGAGTEGVTYAGAVTLLGVTDVALIDEMVSALAAQDGAAVFGVIDRLVEAGHDPRRFASDLLQRLRDLVLLRVAPEAARQGLVDAPEDQIGTMSDQAGLLGAGTLTRFAEIVHTGLVEMRGATAPRLLLELLCARMLLPAADDADGAVLHRLERLERRLTIAPPDSSPHAHPGPTSTTSARQDSARETATTRPGVRPQPNAAPERPSPSVAPERPSPPPAQPEPPDRRGPAATPPSGVVSDGAVPAGAASGGAAPAGAESPGAESAGAAILDAAAVRRVWQALLDAVREQSRAAQVLLSNATASAVQGDTLILTLPTAPLARRLSDERNVEMIKAALRTVLGVDWKVRCEHAGGDPAVRSAPRQAQPQRAPQPPQRSRAVQRPPEPATHPAERRPAAPRRPAPPDDGIPLPPEPPDLTEPPEPEPDDPAPTSRSAAAASTRPAAPAPQTPGLQPPRPQTSRPRPAPEDDEEAMLAEAADAERNPAAARHARHPDELALELLTEQLGARRIDS